MRVAPAAGRRARRGHVQGPKLCESRITASTEFGAYGRTHGFVTLTPQLLRPGVPRWDFGPGLADIGYLADLLTEVESTLCVDTRRIYATGLSMGGFTTSSLGCQLADRLAAITPVAELTEFDWCTPARPVPVITLHGTADPIVAYEGGTGPNARLLPSPDGSGSADPAHGDRKWKALARIRFRRVPPPGPGATDVRPSRSSSRSPAMWS
ncbi:alpha/beta hydrolase family esterase [Nocardia grenadensis]|uniref:alpha/beta hydrolase family esterase n=1 Tax=Nocardia grenadensis TaxID=931537 RepID=UPI003D9094F9